MKIPSIIEGTRVNGPGSLLGVWVQGCLRNCQGCFNADMCRMDGGHNVSVNEIVWLALRHQYDGISVSGGEPLYQSEELAQLLEECLRSGMDTLVYIGYMYERLFCGKGCHVPALRLSDLQMAKSSSGSMA